MPRKPKFIHPVRAIRNATGLSQALFGDRIGCTAGMIEKIENGKRPLPPNLESQIRLFAGVREIKENSLPLDMEGKPFTTESFKQWRVFIKEFEKTHKNAWAKEMQAWLAIFLEAAAREGVEKVQTVYTRMKVWLCETEEVLNLSASVEAVLNENKAPLRRTFTYGKCRKNKVLAYFWGFKDDKAKKDDEKLTLTIETKPSWPNLNKVSEPDLVEFPLAPIPNPWR